MTVTDSDGAQSEAFVDLRVVPEPDYPPQANAGSDVVLKLPNSEVVLNGNASSDDKPGLSYSWENLSEQDVDIEVRGERGWVGCTHTHTVYYFSSVG